MSWVDTCALILVAPIVAAVAFFLVAIVLGMLPSRRLPTVGELAQRRKRAHARELSKGRWSFTEHLFEPQPEGSKAELYRDFVRFRARGSITARAGGFVVADTPEGSEYVWSDGAISKLDAQGRELERYESDISWLRALERRKQEMLVGDLVARVADAARRDDWQHTLECIRDARALGVIGSEPSSDAPDEVLAWARRERSDVAWGPLDPARYPVGDPENFPTCMEMLLEEQAEDEPKVDPTQLEFLGTPDVGSYSGHLFRDHAEPFLVYEMYVDRYHYARPELRYASAADVARGVVLQPRLTAWLQRWSLEPGPGAFF